ncbi:SusD/RagB family nutrient-binding outer membrane lipoprotein [Lacinutrix algicola]|uniref:SusD/RagB family nutrient-binding outer membrane lipoprotein n=1 Tax=Lacinutrix algicola TaxID=342954 RepID=UPI0006E1EFC1|nr:SusD/RagB family nutrient-binding outer membrane lipoprotein [Lacinutrix algicola]
MKKHISKFIIALGFITVFSCGEEYLDINDSPNSATASVVTPDLILAGALKRAYDGHSATTNQLGNVFMYNWGANINSFSSGFVTEYSLDIDNTFYSTVWDNTYIRLANFQNIITNEDPAYSNHKAIALIAKTFYMQYIVDLYGDAPYSQAWLGGANLYPAYDDDLTIYRSLYSNLEEAITLINASTGSNPGNADIVFGGDMAQWERFANTLKLRLLVRESDATSADSQTYVASKMATLNSVEFLTTDVTINPGYEATTDKQNPFWDRFFTTDGIATTTRQFVVAGDYAMKYLNGSLTGVSDSRRERLYAPASDGSYSGVIQGAVSSDPTTPSALSILGPGIIISASQDGYMMTASESYFLQSEAALNLSLTGDPKALFESGVEASFTLLGADIGNYLASNQGWDASTNKLETIMTQKWLATNGLNAIESYIDYTRTGYPVIPLATTAQQSTKPFRLLYPSSELIGNSQNVPSQNTNSAYTTKVFWNE